jgi:hypothetical protein
LLDLADAPFKTLDAMAEATDWPLLLWQMTGGLPRQLARLRAEVMDWALINNVSQVTTDLVFQVFVQSPKFSIVRARNQALANHDINALMHYRDLPLNQLREYWLRDVPAAARKKLKPETTSDSQLTVASTDEDEESNAAAEQQRLITGLKSLTDEASRERRARQAGGRGKSNVE